MICMPAQRGSTSLFSSDFQHARPVCRARPDVRRSAVRCRRRQVSMENLPSV